MMHFQIKNPRLVGGVILLVGITLLLGLIYYMAPLFGFFYMPVVYLALGGVLGLVYVIYNRGFVNKNACREDLADTMSDAEKDAFLALGKERFERSRPLLYLLCGIVFIFLIDLAYLYILPIFEGLFS